MNEVATFPLKQTVLTIKSHLFFKNKIRNEVVTFPLKTYPVSTIKSQYFKKKKKIINAVVTLPLKTNPSVNMVFNATFNNISVISWQSVLLVEELILY